MKISQQLDIHSVNIMEKIIMHSHRVRLEATKCPTGTSSEAVAFFGKVAGSIIALVEC